MRPRQRQPLKDEVKRAHRERIDAISKQRDEAVQILEKRLLGEQRSTSIDALSGGRPESNRRKF